MIDGFLEALIFGATFGLTFGLINRWFTRS
jgi:hypothetical protein